MGGGDIFFKSNVNLRELIQIGEGIEDVANMPWKPDESMMELGRTYSDDGKKMAPPWEKYINGIYHLDEMASHQGEGLQSSKIDSMYQLMDGSIIPFEIKYSNHNAMHYESHLNDPVSFFTTREQIACLAPGGMVFNTLDKKWWPTTQFRIHFSQVFNDPTIKLTYTQEGYFIVGRVWKSQQEGEDETASWIKMSHSFFNANFHPE